jgi:hypothetical protein
MINLGNSNLLPKNFSISRRNSILYVGFHSLPDLFGTKSMQSLTDYGNSLNNELTK